MREREREAETQAEGEAGSMRGAQRRTQSQDPRIVPWAKGRRQTAEPPRDPPDTLLDTRQRTPQHEGAAGLQDSLENFTKSSYSLTTADPRPEPLR